MVRFEVKRRKCNAALWFDWSVELLVLIGGLQFS